MSISGEKSLEREIFKKFRTKSSSLIRKNVEKNVKLYVDSVSQRNIKNKYIGIYWPLKNEVDITSLRFKYSCALPRCEGDERLIFCSWEEEKLTKDYKGIPSPDSSFRLSYDLISMLFIPCLAVDRNLTRLGYGGGYFDRLREDKNWRNIPCIGVLTSNCVSNNLLSRDDWDIPLSGFITEKEILV